MIFFWLGACGVFGTSGDGAPPAKPGPPADPPPNEVPTGVFVRASKPDPAADGTAEHPFSTLAQALEKAGKRAVIACAEEYTEPITLRDGTSMYGFYDCTTIPWKRVDRRARITSARSPVVTAEGLKEDTRVSGFDIVAPDFSGREASVGGAWTDESSVAAVVADSPKLVIANGSLVARAGAAGVRGRRKPVWGESGADDVGATTGTGQGTHASAGAPGSGGKKYCVDGSGLLTGVGGAGGQGVEGDQIAASGKAGGGGGGGAGGVGASGPAPKHDGQAGKQPPRQRDGAAGKVRLTRDGPVRGDGEAGVDGLAGAGGGGGGGETGCHIDVPTGSQPCSLAPGTIPAGGGGGGAGGCPGRASSGGVGGGSSIALYVRAGSLKLDGVKLEAGPGGTGGEAEDPLPPTEGQAGAAGGCAGPTNPPLFKCPAGYANAGVGGAGSRGGEAGRSGPGAPGVAVGIVSAPGVNVVTEGCSFGFAGTVPGGTSAERATLE